MFVVGDEAVVHIAVEISEVEIRVVEEVVV